jgi:aminoglycoside phosphotransferase (APT) family kinase protein
MMIENNRLIIIDFDRCDFGDPWEEFNRIVWSAQASPLFASGIVDGYFDNNVPQEFWRLLALYIGSNLLGSLPWAVQFGEDEVKTMLGQAEQVLNWYDDMNRIVPAWYKDKVCPA